MRTAIIKNMVVVNIVILPDDWTRKSTKWQPPEGCIAIPSEYARIGYVYLGGNDFQKPEQPENEGE